MMELFKDTSSWENVATENWAVAGGESIGLGAVLGGEAKVMQFTHGDLKTSKALLMVSGSVGAKFEAEIPVGGVMGLVKGGLVDTILNWGGHVKKVTDGSGVNPLNFSPPANVYVKTPFSLKDLEFANAVTVGAGTTGGVVEAGLTIFTFHHRDGRQLFTMEDLSLQGAIGAGINMGSFQASRLINLRPTALPASQRAANRQFQENLPYKYSPYNRGPGGGI